MYVTLEELKKINKVQLEIFRNTAEVCEKLGIKWFMVHGSLLGTIRNEGFIPYDDDIDIAMNRKDYERFIKEAPALIGENYFVQTKTTDKNYPLSFAKVRDNRTTYICEAVKNIDMHHGIYIDIFPIDYSISTDKVRKFLFKFFSLRVSASLWSESRTTMQKIKRALILVLCPSVKFAIRQSEALLKSAKVSDKVTVTGGKPQEGAVPAEWFETLVERTFEGIRVYIPKEYDKNLRLIYGDYETCSLVEDKMLGNKVKLNAVTVDIEKPYTAYMSK